MKPLVIIPARGGSKGVPGKNIKLLQGKPLIYYTIEAARQVFEDYQIVVSTDDPEIKECVEKTGLKVPFLRPTELATDEADSYGVIVHALNQMEKQGYYSDVVVLLQPTSPFRNSAHIEGALKNYDSSLDMVVSVKETKSNPYYSLFEEDEFGFLRKSKNGSFSRRQDCPKVWEYNGAIYIINVKSLYKGSFLSFKKIRKYLMNEADSLDIDSELDWKLAECTFKLISGK